jgi:hypothetical protein
MYETIRKIHLYTGLSLLAFVAMYFVTGYVIIHEGWLPAGSLSRSSYRAPLSKGGEKPPEAYAVDLQEQFGLRGKRLPPQRLQDGRWRFRYVRPGVSYEAVVSAAGDSVQVTRSDEPLRRVLIGFHRLHGYGGGWLYDLWAFMYDLASAAMILFALSGIYMWYKLTRKRLLGWVILGLSFSYAAATLLYLVHAP